MSVGIDLTVAERAVLGNLLVEREIALSIALQQVGRPNFPLPPGVARTVMDSEMAVVRDIITKLGKAA